MRWLTSFYDFRFIWTATAAIGIHPTKAWLSRLVNFKNAIWMWGHFRRTICNKIVLNLEKMPQKCTECFRLLLDHLAGIEHQFLSSIRDSRKAKSLWGMMRGVGGEWKSIYQSWLAKGVKVRVTMLRFYGSSGRDSVGSGQLSSNRVRDISTKTMHQYMTPSLSQTVWSRWASNSSAPSQ